MRQLPLKRPVEMSQCAGIGGRDAVGWPAFERGSEGVVDGVFGEVKIAEANE